MASPPLGPPEPPNTMRLNVWCSVSVAAKPYGQSAPGTTWAPLYYEVKCVVFCVSCSKALWPVRPWDQRILMASPPLGPPDPPYTMKELTNMQTWKNEQYTSIFCDLCNYFEIWHFYQIIHICWISKHMWTISSAVETPKLLHYPMKSILIRNNGRYRHSLLFQCNFFQCSYFNDSYHCSLS